MYYSVPEGLGLLEILLHKQQRKTKEAKEKAEESGEENVDELTNIAQRVEKANRAAAEIRTVQENALVDMFRSFYGVPWEQVGLIALAGLAGLYIILGD